MRITSTAEQFAYLASIGASKATIAQPAPATVQPANDNPTTPRRCSGRVIQWRAILLVIIALLYSLARLAHAQQPQVEEKAPIDARGQIDRDGDHVLRQRLDALEKGLVCVRELISRAVTRDQVAPLQAQIRGLDQWLAAVRDALLGNLSEDREHVTRQIESIQAGLDELKTTMSTVSATHEQHVEEIAALVASTAEKGDAQRADARGVGRKLIEPEPDALRGSLADFNRVVTCSVGISVLGIGLLISGRILMEKRIRDVGQNAISRLSETVATIDGDPRSAPGLARSLEVNNKANAENKATIEPMRHRPLPLPTPLEQVQAIIDSANKFRHIRVKPMLSSGSWEVGLAIVKGKVRSENQDYGLHFKTDGHDVLIVADGCGGIPHGQRAAYLAAVGAAVSVVRAYGMAPRWYTPHVQDVAARAIMDAAHRLAVEGDKLNVTEIRGGLRTTLIVVIGNKREVGYAYIGDGGGARGERSSRSEPRAQARGRGPLPVHRDGRWKPPIR